MNQNNKVSDTFIPFQRNKRVSTKDKDFDGYLAINMLLVLGLNITKLDFLTLSDNLSAISQLHALYIPLITLFTIQFL